MLEPLPYKRALLKEALNNLIGQKDYHIAPPTKKNIMVHREYAKILRRKQLKNFTWKKGPIKG